MPVTQRTGLCQQFGDHAARLGDERYWTTGTVGQENMWIDSQQVVHRCQHILGSNRVGNYLTCMFVSRSHNSPARDPPSRKQGGIGLRPVIATTASRRGDLGSAAMLADADVSSS